MKQTEIIRDYAAGRLTLEKANQALRASGASVTLRPEKNVLTEAEKRRTVVGYYPEQASGFGLLDTGTGTLDKVRVRGGQLVDCDCGESYALVYVADRLYHVRGKTLTE